MTSATITQALLGNCYKPWCLGQYDCTAREDPGNLRLHAGRSSTAQAVGGITIEVAPQELDNQDRSIYTGPLVQVDMYLPEISKVSGIDMTAATAVEFSNALASFAACAVPVGAEVTFYGSSTPTELNGESITIRRLEDHTYRYGKNREKTFVLGDVEMHILNSTNETDEGTAIVSSVTAAVMARCVAMAAREVTA